MKKFFLLIVLAAFAGAPAVAQRLAYVDTEYILDKMPEYKEAQEELDKIAEGWKQEIEMRYEEIDQLYKKFQAEQYLMDETTRRRKENEIIEKEQAVKKFQTEKFGYEGELFMKRQELVKPIQDKVFNAITELAQNRNYDIVLDKASAGATMLFANPQYDRSDDILRALGF